METLGSSNLIGERQKFGRWRIRLGQKNGMKEKPNKNWSRFDEAQIRTTTEIAGYEGRGFWRFAIKRRMQSEIDQNDSHLR
jgi:hypothetical protein